MATVTIENDPEQVGKKIIIFIEYQFDPRTEGSMIREALKQAAKEYAEEWVQGNSDKITERLNVDAITNMIMIEVAKQQTDSILERR
jgi:hypothetical protein